LLVLRNSILFVRPKIIIENLIILGIIFTPIFNVFEIISRFNSGGLVDITTADFSTPTWVKLIKDIIFISVFICSSLLIINNFKAHKSFKIFILLITVITTSFFSTFIYNPITALAGLRWALPMLTMFLLVGHIDKNFLFKITKILMLLLLIHFFLQIIQTLFYVSRGGLDTLIGRNTRPGGLFYAANAGGLFSCMVYYFTTQYAKRSKIKRIVKILSIISVFVTSSATSYIIILILFSLNIISKLRLNNFMTIFLPLIFFIVLLNLTFITGRLQLGASMGSRNKNIIEAVKDVGIISTSFGYGTITGKQLAKVYKDLNIATMPADSNYASIIINIGILGFVLIMLLLFNWLLKVYINYNEKAFSLTIIFILSSMTLIVFEAYPMNLLFSIGFANHINNIYN